MPQATYGDAESLFRAAHNELMRVAYALLGNRADTEDAAQDSFFKLVTAWHRVGALVMRTEDYTSFIADFPGVPDLVKKQTYDRRTDRS